MSATRGPKLHLGRGHGIRPVPQVYDWGLGWGSREKHPLQSFPCQVCGCKAQGGDVAGSQTQLQP